MTRQSLPGRILGREVVGNSRSTSVKAFYGDHKWVSDLDIANELSGHSGCVNALSWAKSGRLLASGSDDMYLNIHSYLPDDDCNPFKLTTTISTGHSANIFSVKFMPHSNDRTLVTCAGDSEIRIFDLEYSSRSYVNASTAADAGITRNGIRFMSQGDTNAKVYRSHSDRVKRIVTESSPHLFLSCSEDGEVRQWDLRQPSSYYPKPRAGFRMAEPDDPNVPPPLITYKRHGIDLNTISCSPSQPHYIALGGAHLHAFLHDRRMMGRDLFDERGASASPDQVREATQCVRRFAPRGQKRMSSASNGHITACKISDAHPNNLIVSWSGDCIYSFDLIRDPDADDTQPAIPVLESRVAQKSKTYSNLKRRKREVESPVLSEAAVRASPRPRTRPVEGDDHFLAVSYGNGQSELIPLRNRPEMTESQQKAQALGEAAMHISDQIFGVKIGSLEEDDSHVTGYDFSPVLSIAASCIDGVDDAIRSWKYPMNLRDPATAWHMEARRVRDATRRFVQCAGMLARLLGGQSSEEIGPRTIGKFAGITAAPNESQPQSLDDHHTLFCLDFIKAIGLWLGSGPGALVDGFSARRNTNASRRNPIPSDSGIEAIEEILIPHLLARARPQQSVPNIDASRFEVDGNLTLFATEKDAVLAFQRALQTPFADLSDFAEPQPGDAQDRRQAIRFWGFSVARALLKSANLVRDLPTITVAFGGVDADDNILDQSQPHNPQNRTDVELATGESGMIVDASDDTTHQSGHEQDESILRTTNEHIPVHSRNEYSEDDEDDDGDEDEDDDTDDGDDDDDDEAENEEDYEDDSSSSSSTSSGTTSSSAELAGRRIFMAARERMTQRARVQRHTPCHAAVRSYRGHLNVATVKDVNFFGLNDEYVVSGSDSGHVMIWDAATTQLLNILEGDSDVVNVVQGHPYEPMLAVSGIDDTIKIFSPDNRARRDAFYGHGVECPPDRHARRATTVAYPPLFFDSDTSDGNEDFADDAPNTAPANRHNTDTDADEDAAGDDEDTEPARAHTKARSKQPQSHLSTEADSDADADADTTETAQASHGLRQGRRLYSRRSLSDQEEIVRANERRSRQGTREAFVTRDALAMLAMRLRHVGAAAALQQAGDGEDGLDPGAVPADDCGVQ